MTTTQDARCDDVGGDLRGSNMRRQHRQKIDAFLTRSPSPGSDAKKA